MCKLEIELVPSSSFYSNVRSEVTTAKWDKIRKKCYDEASDTCEICGDNGKNQGKKHNVECHEIWDYDMDDETQTLIGFIALCPACHQSKHFGLAQLKRDDYYVRKHLKSVNGWTDIKLDNYLNEKWEEWHQRNQINWSLNIDYINEYMEDVGVSKLDRMLSNLKKKK